MTGKKRIGVIWSWIERIAARLLIPLMFLQFLTGFAVLHPRIFGGVLLKSTAAQMHSIIQPPTALVFAVHGMSAIRRVLLRHGIGGRSVDVVLSVVGVGLVAITFYENREECPAL